MCTQANLTGVCFDVEIGPTESYRCCEFDLPKVVACYKPMPRHASNQSCINHVCAVKFWQNYNTRGFDKKIKSADAYGNLICTFFSYVYPFVVSALSPRKPSS